MMMSASVPCFILVSGLVSESVSNHFKRSGKILSCDVQFIRYATTSNW